MPPPQPAQVHPTESSYNRETTISIQYVNANEIKHRYPLSTKRTRITMTTTEKREITTEEPDYMEFINEEIDRTTKRIESVIQRKHKQRSTNWGNHKYIYKYMIIDILFNLKFLDLCTCLYLNSVFRRHGLIYRSS